MSFVVVILSVTDTLSVLTFDPFPQNRSVGQKETSKDRRVVTLSNRKGHVAQSASLSVTCGCHQLEDASSSDLVLPVPSSSGQDGHQRLQMSVPILLFLLFY